MTEQELANVIWDILANFVHSDTDSEDVDLAPIYSRLERSDKLFAVV